MVRKKYTEEQIIAVLREGEAGAKVADLCRKYSMSDASYCNCPQIHLLLRRQGLVVNHKRMERIYREEGLSLRKRRQKKTAAQTGVILPAPEKINERWSMDLVTDSIVTGRRFRALVIVDDYSREILSAVGL